MEVLRTFARFAGSFVKTLRLALPKIGAGWMFALLTSNFNQITIQDLQIAAVLITVMISMHNFLSPFQVIFGRLADQHPILGYRRTPYFFFGAIITSTVFLLLPGVAFAMSTGSVLATVGGYVLLILFGIGLAASGDAHHSLIAEVTDERRRGGVVAVVWTFTIISAIASAIVIKIVMPAYDQASMQALYNLTPMIVLGSGILGLLGMERRMSAPELRAAVARSRSVVPERNPVRAAAGVLRRNAQARTFFAFVFLSILGIFLQDAILEVFGRQVFGMTLREATSFGQIWGGAVLGGMALMGVLSSILPLSKKGIATAGGAITALGLGLLTVTALTGQRTFLMPSLILQGLGAGFFNIGALSMMMDLTVDGATGLYMGLWGMAQSFGTGFASIISGTMKSGLIETGLLSTNMGYTVIFGLEAVIMVGR
jgi:MFS transporter, BCD family, chlorophyll transporter